MSIEQDFVNLLNQIRANPKPYGELISVDLSQVAPAPPLTINLALSAAALAHSQDMAARNYFAHNTPEGVTPQQRIASAGYTAQASGEALAAGTVSYSAGSTIAQLIVDAGDPINLGHRKLLLGIGALEHSLREIGAGFVTGAPSPYFNLWTIDFGLSVSDPVGYYVRKLYQVALLRQPSPDELSSWVQALQTGTSKLGVAGLVEGSLESRAISVAGYYQELLGRIGTPAEIAGWADESLDLVDIEARFESSPEFAGW
jgi:uncharacterized protein YkwD